MQSAATRQSTHELGAALGAVAVTLIVILAATVVLAFAGTRFGASSVSTQAATQELRSVGAQDAARDAAKAGAAAQPAAAGQPAWQDNYRPADAGPSAVPALKPGSGGSGGMFRK